MPAARRRNDALVRVFRQYLRSQNESKPRRNKPQIMVMVQAETIGTDYLNGFVAATGATLTRETIERLLCDCDMHRVVVADGVVLEYGRAVWSPHGRSGLRAPCARGPTTRRTRPHQRRC